MKVELDLSNYATKADFKNVTGVNTSNFAVSLIQLLYNQKMIKSETTPVVLSRKSEVVKNEVVKKTAYDELVNKGNSIQTIDTINLNKKADYNTKIAAIEKKILNYDHSKCISTQELNKLSANNFLARLAQAKVPTKADVAVL